MEKFKMINKMTGANIKKNDNELRDKSIKKCGIMGVVLNLILFAVKLIVGIIIINDYRPIIIIVLLLLS